MLEFMNFCCTAFGVVPVICSLIGLYVILGD